MEEGEFLERLKKHWERNIRDGYLYHGTSKIYLDHILKEGLKPEGVFSKAPAFAYTKLLRFLYGDKPHDYYVRDVTRGVFVTHARQNAREYARNPSERVRMLLEDALPHIERMPEDVKQAFLKLAEHYLEAKEKGGVVLGIKMRFLSPLLKKNEETRYIGEAVENFNTYYDKFVKPLVALVKEIEKLDDERARERVLKMLNETNDPLREFFFNKPLNIRIPPEYLEIIEEVDTRHETQVPEILFLQKLRSILKKYKKK